ncbi:hypothetical protein AQUCO_01100068v1 [Aquilegia coerulea]|uniref:DNA helicase Pif1-like 2B domain-containing protein n=1 Tax=Aquilegia coerulea TaxID=218851 RepID=A0A2G5E5G5_AQUCA|nr:hypothetical protein AQUCO_01100068v1 [Aquilegia coerulea]
MFEYLVADKVMDESTVTQKNGKGFTSEFSNSQEPASLPHFKLSLKIGTPIMLLRNISPRDGLCSGTRLMVVKCASRVIEANILTGEKAGDLVFIPRITITPTITQLAFEMLQRQFPVRLAYAMTINKSQGQSVKDIGLDLRNPVFSHGQLYVALSRCTSSERITVLLPLPEEKSTTNIMYSKVLLCESKKSSKSLP